MDQVNFELLYLLTLPFTVNADSVLDPFPTGGETYGLHISTWGHFSLRLSIVESFWSPSAFMTPEKSVKERRAIKVSRPSLLFRHSEKKFYPEGGIIPWLHSAVTGRILAFAAKPPRVEGTLTPSRFSSPHNLNWRLPPTERWRTACII